MDVFFHGLNLWDQYRYFWSSLMENVGDLILDDVDFVGLHCQVMLHLCRWTAWRVVLDLNVIHDTQKHPQNSYATTLKSLNVSETLLFRHVVHRNLQRLRPMLDFYVALVMSLRRIGLAKCWDVKYLPWVMSFIAPNVWNQTKSWRFPSKLRCNNLGVHGIFAYGCFQK